MFNGGQLPAFTIHPTDTRICMVKGKKLDCPVPTTCPHKVSKALFVTSTGINTFSFHFIPPLTFHFHFHVLGCNKIQEAKR